MSRLTTTNGHTFTQAKPNKLERLAPESQPWRNHVLWVDDRPDNTVYERRLFSAIGVECTLALSTDSALAHLQARRFGAVISDMGRAEGPDEGYVLLERMRSSGDQTPFFIYAGSDSLDYRVEAAARGAQGSTNDSSELVRAVMSALLS